MMEGATMSIFLSITIIEDQLNQAKILADTLHQISFPNEEISFNVNISQDYIKIYEQEMPIITKNEIYLIDIHLNTYFSGIDFAKHILAIEPEVFIVYFTSDPSKSITAINEQTHPLAYILKGMDTENLKTQLETTLNKISNQLQYDLDKKQLIRFSYHGDHLYLNPNKILFVQTAAGYQKKTILHSDTGEFMLNYRLIDVKKLLPDIYFQKQFKSVIINVSRIYKLNRTTGFIMFDDESELYVGSKVIDKLKKGFSDR